jgi:hypothetical protein
VISIGSDSRPRWGCDSTELFYIAPTRKLMSVAIAHRRNFEPSTPKALFDLQDATDHAVSRDGRRFLRNRIISDPGSEPLTVVLDWPAALKR